MKTQIFKSYSDFLKREDKSINGVSEEFARENPNWEEMNLTNKGCWNCTICTNCNYCNYCTVCTDCAYCDYCAHCINCADCTYCDYCAHCIDCDSCTRCAFKDDLSGVKNC